VKSFKELQEEIRGVLSEETDNMEVKVTKIGGDYHARLIDKNGKILDEYACKEKEDIGWISREMLRWQDKMGNSTPQTRAARKRQTGNPVGKVWKVKNKDQ
jgi:hypothetical protein